MGDAALVQRCFGCQGLFPAVDGPTHAYMLSSPGCWAAYGRVLARHYEDRAYAGVHRLCVDTYAVQHPGVPGPQSIQSVGVHLVRLCRFIEQGLAPDRANDVMLAASHAQAKARYHWLEPPASPGALTIADLEAAHDIEPHMRIARDWAAQVWAAWSAHHDTVRTWARAL